MNLHAIGPRLHSKVSSLRESFFEPGIRIQTNPTPHARVDSIGSDNPLRLDDLFAEDGAFIGQARDRRVPKQANSTLFCAFYHLLVEDRSTYSKTACTRKVGFHRVRGVNEADSAKNLPIARTNRDA
jgi:hypothetical protein